MRNKAKILIIFSFFSTILLAQKPATDEEKMNRFIDDLMKKMTIEEKVGQLNLAAVGFDVTGPILSKGVDEKIEKGLVGAVFNTFTPNAVRKLQELAVTKSRLKIPLIFGYDVIHGHKTIFPIPLGLSASWNLDLIERTARAAGEEASADGLNWVFSPMLDISRDPRWGRVSEGSGEDPYLGAEIAKVMINGFQQNDVYKTNSVMACVKHFALYGASEAGRDYNTTDMSKIRMYNEYLPPYKAAIEAGAETVMTSFNEVDGIPATGNKWLLDNVLRKEWGFKGFVVTDYTAIMEMVHHGVGDTAMVCKLALEAGTDMDMVSEYFIDYLPGLIREGKIDIRLVDKACRRVLEAKYKIGLFENPYRYINEQRAQKEIFNENKLALSKEAAIKSMVLLKNEENLLPLSSDKKIAFVGPLVADQRNMLGNWSGAGDWRKSVSVKMALEKQFGANKFIYAKGCNLIDDKHVLKKINNGNVVSVDKKTPQELIDEALDMVKDADVIVAVLGEAFNMSGEAASRSNIELPENQKDLLKELKRTGKPVVLVLINGRPLALQWENENIDAILEAWFPGTKAGEAIVDVLFGNTNPSGKITMTFPRNVGQIPVYYNHKNTGRPYSETQKYTTKYLDVPNEPLYPFGYGLSYTTFSYGDIMLDNSTLKEKGKITAKISISNTGEKEGTETVQLYIRDLVGTVTRPVKELKAFRQITLKAGESQTVSFEITEEMLKFYNADLQYIAEPGDFKLFIGGNSRDVKEAMFTLSRQVDK